MKRRTFLVLAHLFWLSLLVSPGWAGPVALTILHTNDTHGHLLPFSYPAVVPPGSGLEGLTARTNIGGIARRATLVKRIRQELQPKNTTVWLVDAGDFSDGTPFSLEYHGEADVEAMNAAGYTVATIGNHEFSNPLADARRILALARYPVLCANAVETATGKPLVQPYTVRAVGPLRVAVFGLITREAAGYRAAKEGVQVADEVETARALVPALRRQADIVVLISHAGEEMDEKLAAAVPGIDVIVGGHSHSRLPSGAFVWQSEDLKADDVNGTVIVQAHQWAGELGRLDLLFVQDASGAWHVDRYRARLIPITPDIPEDETVAGVVERYWKPIAGRYGEVIGEAADDFTDRGDDLTPYNLMADAVRETFQTDIALENMGGVRAPLVKGQITRADLAALDPFDNTVVTFKLSGRELRQLLIRHAPAVSGIHYRLVSGELVEATVGSQPLDDTHIYTGATSSYFAGYALKDARVENTGKARLDVLINYIRQKRTVRPAYDGRRVVIGRVER